MHKTKTSKYPIFSNHALKNHQKQQIAAIYKKVGRKTIKAAFRYVNQVGLPTVSRNLVTQKSIIMQALHFRLMLGLMLPTWFLSMWICNTSTTALMLPIAHAILLQLRDTNKHLNNEIRRYSFSMCISSR